MWNRLLFLSLLRLTALCDLRFFGARTFLSQPRNLVAADVSPRHLLRSERRLAPTHVGGYEVMGREAAGRSIRDRSAWGVTALRERTRMSTFQLPSGSGLGKIEEAHAAKRLNGTC